MPNRSRPDELPAAGASSLTLGLEGGAPWGAPGEPSFVTDRQCYHKLGRTDELPRRWKASCAASPATTCGVEVKAILLQTTALVNEAYLKLVDQAQVNWQNRPSSWRCRGN